MHPELYRAVCDNNLVAFKEHDWITVRDQLTPANNTVLHLACQTGSLACLNEILSRADESLVLQVNSRGDTALHLAARNGHYDAVTALISTVKSWVQNTSPTLLQNLIRAANHLELETALHAAVRYNHKDVVELLVKEDPSYSYPQNKHNETPLYLAAFRCLTDVIKVILNNCESLTYEGPDGRTALHASLMNAEGYECSILLGEKNKDLIKSADNNGWTALHYGANNNNFVSVIYLLKADQSVAYLTDKHKRTALHIAAYKGSVSVINALVFTVPDILETVDENGQNFLHIAVKQRQKSVLKFFFSSEEVSRLRIDFLNQKDKEGNTPLHLIAKFECYVPELDGRHDWIWKADWDAVDNTNWTPADVLQGKKNGTLIDEEALIGATLDKTYNRYLLTEWIKDKAMGGEDESGDVGSEKFNKEMVNTHMIVAALITTIALTAGFAMPGGFDGNQGPNQGSPLLIHKTAFKTFMVTDAMALLFSLSSLFLYFLTSLYQRISVVESLLIVAIAFNIVSVAAMMLAFIAGTSAVLSHSSGLTLTVCIISSLFLLLFCSVCFVYFRKLVYVLKIGLRAL
ncbi:hypothetical protein DCAR_0100619 [Daucus carota subsp. sativus]|uniref:PGG domain-containing protein n=2 Tax=Daucus carota subsp. sativus TaxID=79200 RepID=A0AAF0W0Z2_DAUCS|nr:hypothetical protein DCAR_0100619 [Daucus carota subsp. sativus]